MQGIVKNGRTLRDQHGWHCTEFCKERFGGLLDDWNRSMTEREWRRLVDRTVQKREEQQPKSKTPDTHDKERDEQHSLFGVGVRIVSRLLLLRASILTTFVLCLGFFLSLLPFPKDLDAQGAAGAAGVEVVKQTLHLRSVYTHTDYCTLSTQLYKDEPLILALK